MADSVFCVEAVRRSELHARGYTVLKGAAHLDEGTATRVKAPHYDEKGLPSGPDGAHDPRRQQSSDKSDRSTWIQEVKPLLTESLRTSGHLLCSKGGKVVKKVHALKSLPTPGYDEASSNRQEGDQGEHTDESADDLKPYMRGRGDEDMPLSVILAFMPGTRLRIRPFGGEWTVVRLEPGDLIVFRGDVCHHGMGYARENIRIHAYVYSPDYKPGPSSINPCS